MSNDKSTNFGAIIEFLHRAGYMSGKRGMEEITEELFYLARECDWDVDLFLADYDHLEDDGFEKLTFLKKLTSDNLEEETVGAGNYLRKLNDDWFKFPGEFRELGSDWDQVNSMNSQHMENDQELGPFVPEP
jgi:hypothetical protein